MKKLYILLFLAFSFITNAQIINFTDANFKAKLLSANTNNIASTETPDSNGIVTTYNTIDTNGDGEIQVVEAQVIKFLRVSSSSISELTGIDAFVNLEALWCEDNQLTSLNLLNNSNIKYLNCRNNNINSLNISSLTNLESLICSYNQLTSIDLSFYSNLRNLDLQNNQLSIINLSQNTLLYKFYIQFNNLTSLDVSFNTGLRYLRAQNNLLANITIGANNILEELALSNNQLTFIDLTQAPALKGLSLDGNQLSSLNLTQNINLEYLYVYDNNLTSLNTTQNINIDYLSASSNQITNIDVTQNVALKYLYLSYNQIANIDVTQNTILEEFTIRENLLTNLNVTQNSNLKVLSSSFNQITSFDFSQNSLLYFLRVSNNPITSLDISQNLNLESLVCNSTLINSLDVTSNSLLINLLCNDTPSLEALFMKNNNATAWSNLSFSGNPNLEFVCCDDDDLADVQQKIIDYGYTGCEASNLTCVYPTLYEVSGNAQYDYYADGCNLGIDDIFVPNVKYEIFDGTSSVITSGNQIGDYYIPLEAGNYTITPVLENPNYFNVSPTNFSVDFPTDASPFEQNVCLTWNGLEYYDDLEVVILPTTPARPGFEAKYKVIVRNKGFDYTNGTLVFTYDDAVLTYTSSTPIFNSSTTNTLTWNFFSDSFSVLEFDVVFDVNNPADSPAVNIDDELSFTAVVAHEWTDYYPADNTFTLDQTVVGSYDPNDKTCLQGETEEVEIVGEYVHYLIRFENTGTYAAEKVVIEDIIDTSKFDVSTLIPIDASHSYYTKITGNVVEFVFDNINLDFNDPDNDGFITYKIKLLPTLTVGDTFSNSANIYFDSNPAIVTNTYTTTIVNTLSSQIFGNEEFVLYPNPAKAILNISTKNQTEIQSVEIYNIIGQVVIAIPNATNTIDVSSLESGTYFIKLNTEKGSTTTKFVKE